MNIEMRGIDKSFGSNQVLKNAGFFLEDGEVHALMGENGAGKSTLMKILTGVYTRDAGKVFVDGLGVGDVGNIVLRDRQHLSQDGLIVVVLTMDKVGNILAGPDVISRGFVYVRESENLMEEVKFLINTEVMKCAENHITDWATIKSTIRDSLREYIFQTTKRNPMILPIIMEI